MPKDFELKAARALESAKLLLSNGDDSGACNRAYYAMLNATRAALIRFDSKLIEIRTHRGLISALNKHLVKDGIIPSEIGNLIKDVKSARNFADYMDDEMPKEIALIAIKQADEFLHALSKVSFENSLETIDSINVKNDKASEGNSDISVCSYCGQICDGSCIGGMKP